MIPVPPRATTALIVAAIGLAGAVALAAFAVLAAADPSPATAAPEGARHDAARTAETGAPAAPAAAAAPDASTEPGPADGTLPDGATVDTELPGITGLRPELLAALRAASADASAEGVALGVTSGWRSTAYQERLLQDAIGQYGSAEEAARWVAEPSASAHVSGDAVDIGPAEAAAWLSERGASYGLCQIYANEAWHFELRPGAETSGCPGMYADASQDPGTR